MVSDERRKEIFFEVTSPIYGETAAQKIWDEAEASMPPKVREHQDTMNEEEYRQVVRLAMSAALLEKLKEEIEEIKLKGLTGPKN